VRLAALDLRGISGMDLEDSGLDPGILGFCVSPKLTCFSLSAQMPPFCVNSVEFVFFVCTVEFMAVTIPGIGVAF